MKKPNYQPRAVGKTQRSRLLRFLNTGKGLTGVEMTERYGTKNPSATVTMLNKAGWSIRSYKPYSKGHVTYRMDGLFLAIPRKYRATAA